MKKGKNRAETGSIQGVDKSALILTARNMQINILRVLNAKLVRFVWGVGKMLKEDEALGQTVSRDGKKSYDGLEIGKKYVSVFGKNFLATAVKVYERYPDRDIIDLVALFVPWTNFKETLKDSSQAKRIEENIRVIKSNKGKKVQAVLENDGAEVVNNVRRSALKNWSEITSVFESKNGKGGTFLLLAGNSVYNGELISKAETLLELLKYEMERDINTVLNTGFWELGRCVNDLHRRSDPGLSWKEFRRYIRACTHQGKNEGTFKVSWLEKMALFNSLIGDAAIAGFIGSVVSWKHILEIITVPDKEKQVYFACLASVKGLNVKELRKAIKDTTDRPDTEVMGMVNQTIHSLFNPTRTIAEIKDGNSLSKVTTIHHTHGLPQRGESWLKLFSSKELYDYLKYDFNSE